MQRSAMPISCFIHLHINYSNLKLECYRTAKWVEFPMQTLFYVVLEIGIEILNQSMFYSSKREKGGEGNIKKGSDRA